MMSLVILYTLQILQVTKTDIVFLTNMDSLLLAVKSLY